MKLPATRSLAVVLLLSLASLVAACGSDGDVPSNGDAAGDSSTQATSVTLTTHEFYFEPDEVTIPAGTDVEFTVDNTQGVIEHDFTLDEADALIHADAGQVATGTVNAPAGTYTFYCSVPGHRASGMEGTITVE